MILTTTAEHSFCYPPKDLNIDLYLNIFPYSHCCNQVTQFIRELKLVCVEDYEINEFLQNILNISIITAGGVILISADLKISYFQILRNCIQKFEIEIRFFIELHGYSKLLISSCPQSLRLLAMDIFNQNTFDREATIVFYTKAHFFSPSFSQKLVGVGLKFVQSNAQLIISDIPVTSRGLSDHLRSETQS